MFTTTSPRTAYFVLVCALIAALAAIVLTRLPNSAPAAQAAPAIGAVKVEVIYYGGRRHILCKRYAGDGTLYSKCYDAHFVDTIFFPLPAKH